VEVLTDHLREEGRKSLLEKKGGSKKVGTITGFITVLHPKENYVKKKNQIPIFEREVKEGGTLDGREKSPK